MFLFNQTGNNMFFLKSDWQQYVFINQTGNNIFFNQTGNNVFFNHTGNNVFF